MMKQQEQLLEGPPFLNLNFEPNRRRDSQSLGRPALECDNEEP